ncbi:MAG: DUF6883 domain-containing protein [Parvularculaceae bacterium]
MSKLPNAQLAIVDESKITGYLLNLDHLLGRAKCQFLAGFGFNAEQWGTLRDAILAHAVVNNCIELKQTQYGTSFAVDGPLSTPDGRRPTVRVVWFVREGESMPRLVTLIPTRMENP